MEIAPEHPERQRVRARIDMEERLLLDRIALNASDVAKWDAQLAALVEAHAANAVSPGGDEAAVAAGDAANPVALGPPQRTDRRVPGEHISQRFAGRAEFTARGGQGRISLKPRLWSQIFHIRHRKRSRQCCAPRARCQSRYKQLTEISGAGLKFLR